MEVPKSTKMRSTFFSANEVSRRSLIFKDLSSSADGTCNRKLDIRASEGNWFGRRLAFAFLHINEYKAKVPPDKKKRRITLPQY